MEVVELKFLLALLGHPPDYHTALSNLRPSESRSDRNRACRQLRDRGLIGCSEEIIQFKTSTSGKALLKLEATDLPISDEELLCLAAGAEGMVTPGKAMKGVKPKKRQDLLQSLETRGLVQAETQIKDVWLTPDGHAFLLHDCAPEGNHTVSFNFLHNYIEFLRVAVDRASAQAPQGSSDTPWLAWRWTQSKKPQEADVLKMIQTLDHELGTHNYLPLFYLRDVLQPPLSRDELDQTIYSLQRQDKIELSSLQDAIAYTAEQVNAGIPQDIGGPLFFVSHL